MVLEAISEYTRDEGCTDLLVQLQPFTVIQN